MSGTAFALSPSDLRLCSCLESRGIIQLKFCQHTLSRSHSFDALSGNPTHIGEPGLEAAEAVSEQPGACPQRSAGALPRTGGLATSPCVPVAVHSCGLPSTTCHSPRGTKRLEGARETTGGPRIWASRCCHHNKALTQPPWNVTASWATSTNQLPSS